MRRQRYPFWLWPNLLSVDAPVVALLWQGFFGACFDASLAWPARAALGLAVWAVYIADRLLDAFRAGPAALTPRHEFHRDHWRLMASLLAVAVSSAIGVSTLLVRPALFRAGLITGTLVLLYLAAVHRSDAPTRKVRTRWLSREAAVASLFTVGTVLAPWLRSSSRTTLLLASTALFLVCWANISLIESFERPGLRRDPGAEPHWSTTAIAARYGTFLLMVFGYSAALLVFRPRYDLAMAWWLSCSPHCCCGSSSTIVTRFRRPRFVCWRTLHC